MELNCSAFICKWVPLFSFSFNLFRGCCRMFFKFYLDWNGAADRRSRTKNDRPFWLGQTGRQWCSWPSGPAVRRQEDSRPAFQWKGPSASHRCRIINTFLYISRFWKEQRPSLAERETSFLHVKALDEFQRVRTEKLFHLREIGGRWQVAYLAPFVVRRKAVVPSALDVEGEQVESEWSVFLLEQMIGHLQTKYETVVFNSLQHFISLIDVWRSTSAANEVWIGLGFCAALPRISSSTLPNCHMGNGLYNMVCNWANSVTPLPACSKATRSCTETALNPLLKIHLYALGTYTLIMLW